MATEDVLKMIPLAGPVHGSIRPPGSKSLTNRALMIAALARGTSVLTGGLSSRDTEVMIDSLRKLGVDVILSPEGTLSVTGCSGQLKSTTADLWCENSGTSIRFLTAACALGSGTYRLDGNERMRERPIQPLILALSQHGIQARCEAENDCPPVVVTTQGLAGGEMTVGGNLSSQYLSGLLMAAPCAQDVLTIAVTGELVSRPYIEMTLALMREFGAQIDEPRPNHFRVAATGYGSREYDIEPDASAASYFAAVAAITGGEITIEGLGTNSLQGDIRFIQALEQMGCTATWQPRQVTVTGGKLQGISIDMNEFSDTAQTLACVAPFAAGPTKIRNIAHNRIKETDRIAAVVVELRRLGIHVDEHPDGMTIHPGPLKSGVVATYDDHRMAMSFALLGLRVPGIQIADPDCTAKTYPHYFDDLNRLCDSARAGGSR